MDHKFYTVATLAALCCAYMLGPAQADQVHHTVTVAAGGQSAPIAIPLLNSPIVISCTQTVVGDVGTGEVTLTASSADNEMIFNGYDASGIITNAQSNLNAHIVYCDFFKHVDLFATTSRQIVLKNSNGAPVTVTIMMSY